jgi:CRISPR-associated protein Csx14
MNNTQPEATINILVDLYNPGEFFACCGLLELAHRLTESGSRALGWFENVDCLRSQFSVSAFKDGDPLTLGEIIESLKECEISTINPESKEGPVLLGSPFNIILDWRPPFPQSKMIKTFAGNQNLLKIVRTLQQAIQEISDNEFVGTQLLGIRKPTSGAVTAFDVEKAEDAIDAGFSMDVQKGRLFRHSRIFLELLALIGGQRFCPQQGEERLERIYFAWKIPLSASLAASTVSRNIPAIPAKGYSFRMYEREASGKYKGFSTARKL